MRATASEPPMLVPLEALASDRGQGGPRSEGGAARSEAPVQRAAREEPSLPFTGFSVLALVLMGAAATSAGRRLQVATAPPARTEHVKPPPATEQPRTATRPRPLYLGIALLGLAALAAAGGRSLLRPRPR